jgi:hypothetical protein
MIPITRSIKHGILNATIAGGSRLFLFQGKASSLERISVSRKIGGYIGHGVVSQGGTSIVVKAQRGVEDRECPSVHVKRSLWTRAQRTPYHQEDFAPEDRVHSSRD